MLKNANISVQPEKKCMLHNLSSLCVCSYMFSVVSRSCHVHFQGPHNLTAIIKCNCAFLNLLFVIQFVTALVLTQNLNILRLACSTLVFIPNV